MRTALLVLLALIVASCGVKRPLIRPKDIPAYEEQQRRKREKIEHEMQEYETQQQPAATQVPVTEPAQ